MIESPLKRDAYSLNWLSHNTKEYLIQVSMHIQHEFETNAQTDESKILDIIIKSKVISVIEFKSKFGVEFCRSLWMLVTS